MDFIQVSTRTLKDGIVEIYPDFVVGRSTDLMVRGRGFYAIWDEEKGLWSTDEYDVQRLVDQEVDRYAAKHVPDARVLRMRSFKSQVWSQFRQFVSLISDNAHQLDEKLTFNNTEVKKSDYVSRRLPYNLAPGPISAWDELVGTLYSPEERAKIEWTIGAIVSGDSKKIQKFLVFYGSAGTGKSTILNIVQKLFQGYVTTFEAKALGMNGNAFATEAFSGNPLVAIQHDGDLSKIEDNTKLNSIISHEDMVFNQKYKASYTSRVNAILLMGTNQPVRISDAKSGLLRRLIDVNPTGERIPPNHYHTLLAQIEFELGALAFHCLDVYQKMGRNYYNAYRPLEMMFQTDIFFNFIEAYYDVFKSQNSVSLSQAYDMYKQFCTDAGVERPLQRHKVREELRSYFDKFHDRITIDGEVRRSFYTGFTAELYKMPVEENPQIFSLVLEEETSLLNLEWADQPAQYSRADGRPSKYWDDSERLINGEMKRPNPSQVVSTFLRDIDTRQEHFVKPPENHIVIDFDLRGDDGEKSLERNLEAASKWPATYAELSKSGEGVHLHYVSEIEPDTLGASYDDGIEVKTFLGNASLRRRLTKCNNVPIATINSGLPLKEKKVLPAETIKSERGLRDLIQRNLRKEIHPGTKPSVDFILHILDEAYLSGMQYDVTDLRNRIIAFANNSSNQPLDCLKMVQRMRFKSEEVQTPVEVEPTDDRIVFFDIEVYPNLFVFCWKYEGSPTVVRMINPTAAQLEPLFKFKLVGFNNRKYDNHIMWGRYMGLDNEQLYRLSKKIIDGVANAMFGEAYDISYADIYEFSSVKMGLKKFQILLGLRHVELDIPWDQPVPKELWNKVVEYCANDVESTEEVFKYRHGDFVARQILAELSGLPINATTQKHTAQIVFQGDKNPQREFIYTDLSKDFPGYEFTKGVSTYRGENVGEGGYVYAEPGLYQNVALLDIASMHPTSIRELVAFGPDYTRRFYDLVDARLAIKRGDIGRLECDLLGGKLKKFVSADERALKDLSYALKIVVNIVYGLTSAKFDNPFRDTKNVDNIVAKRGALFMIDLKHFVQERGFTVAHIKTDSVKIPNATPEIIEEIMKFGEKWGYTFEHEATYDKFCLVNDAVYVAHKDECVSGEWIAVGAQFQHPYVFKTLFEPENPITFEDLCETKQVSKGAIYMAPSKDCEISDMHFVGRTGRFMPVKEEVSEGKILYRVLDDKTYAVAGTKGYRWVESDMAKALLERDENVIDMTYFEKLVDDARSTIDKFGNCEEFING